MTRKTFVRPLFDNDLGIPWDEYQLTIVIAVKAAIQQQVWGQERVVAWINAYTAFLNGDRSKMPR